MKKRIMFMNNSLYGGGAEKVMQTLLNNLDETKYNITLYSLREEIIDKITYTGQFSYKYIYDSINEYDSRIIKIYKKIKNKFKIVVYNKCSPKTFYRLFIRGTYDTEVAFIEGDSTKIISGSPNRNSKKIAWIHIDLEKNHWTKIAFNSFEEEISCYKAFNNIVCVSQSVADSFKRFYGINKNVITRYNPIDGNEIVEKSKEYIVSDQYIRPLVITVGRLVKQKGYDILLNVVKKLIDEKYKFTLWIIGEGELRQELEQFVNRNGMHNCVRLYGFQKNPYKYIKQADLFICSSRAEGFSLAIAEAMILGVPIISTDCAGPNELLNFGEYGMLVENSENGLYNQLKNVLLNPSLINQYSLKSRERSEFFNINNAINDIEDIL